jgi:hypothetical protein
MKRVLFAALGLALCAAPALAQVSSDPDATSRELQILAQRGNDDSSSWRGGRSWRNQSADEDDRDVGRSQSDGRSGREGRQFRQGRGNDSADTQASGRDWQERMARIHAGVAMGRDQGVHIRLRRGDTALDVRCPGSSGELTACIGAVGQLLDRLGPAGPSSTAPANPSGAPSSPQTR